MTNFPDFFKALCDSEPFPWQTMLAQRAARSDWPKLISLPTSSGKTACLDIAVFGLAATANQGVERRLPRRIWFVVDRRIVVDEAFERAKIIAHRLKEAKSGPLREVAEVLKEAAGSSRPLGVARLRGGVWKSDDWARLPSQPTIICSTVDQIGSALLFRAYGHSDETASIYAGLVAHDSLILLDEAHCAVPFMQTLSAVARFRDEAWAERPLKTPFRHSIMSATPPEGAYGDAMFPEPAERIAALGHPRLQQRLTARKLASLNRVKDSEFVSKAATRAQEYASGKQDVAVAVMVNRVATAKDIFAELKQKGAKSADVVLLTGRMRPLDRDVLLAQWESRLKAVSPEPLQKSLMVVTTQCLEVGADFSFDALVTECASLDALRQRFGRLARLGELRESGAVVLIRERDTKNPKDDGDPIYGKAIYETWTWLNEPDQRQADGTVDFGVAAMDRCVEKLRGADKVRFAKLLAPVLDAPVLLPAHLDLLCQTSPRPRPEPDVSFFLHGKGRRAPEARVVFRADLNPENEETWIETLSLLPPTSPEMLSVPLRRLKQWLSQGTGEDEGGDIEGAGDRAAEDDDSGQTARTNFLIWRGRDNSEVAKDLRRLRSNDIVILPLSEQALSFLGQPPEQPEGLGPGRLDLAERAMWQARGRPVLRVRPDVLTPLRDSSSVIALLELASSEEPELADVEAALDAVLDDVPSSPDWLWLKNIVENLGPDFRMEPHPAGGLILTGKTIQHAADQGELEDDLSADADDLRSKLSQAVSWRQHTADVRIFAEDFAERCVDEQSAAAIGAAAQAHDLGKLDWRFQLKLRNGDEVMASSGEPLAKSAELPERRRKRRQVDEDARLPKGFRHEFLSVQLAKHFGLTPADDDVRELALHLIASHHGYARPFAPVVVDEPVAADQIRDLCLNSIGLDAKLSAAKRQIFTPAYRLDSGVPDRFWRLTRRYGWWGLAYLESILRLADWKASRKPGEGTQTAPIFPISPNSAHLIPHISIPLDALDGANPLAFLAALGTLRVLTRVLPQHDLRMSWEVRLGAWRPLLWTAKLLDETIITKALIENSLDLSAMFSEKLLTDAAEASPKNKKGEPRWKDKLLFPIKVFRQFCGEASESPVLAEFAAAWAGETASAGDEDEEVARRTRFDFTAGQQAFVGMLRELRETCTLKDLHRALFAGWLYSSGSVSLRWDTQDEKRQYALQSVDPTNNSKNPPAADRGANFLAVEALPLFPVVPDRRAGQAGFAGKGDSRCWSWPIWMYPIGVDVIRSLLALPLADSDDCSAANRRALGVPIIFQSRIVQPSGRYRCFTPARTL